MPNGLTQFVRIEEFTGHNYRKTPKNKDTQKNFCKYPKIGSVLFYYRKMGPKNTDRIANSVDPDQTALFAKICLSKT